MVGGINVFPNPVETKAFFMNLAYTFHHPNHVINLILKKKVEKKKKKRKKESSNSNLVPLGVKIYNFEINGIIVDLMFGSGFLKNYKHFFNVRKYFF